MQVMLTSSKGEVLGRNPESEDEDDDVGECRVRPGDSITYLYR